MEENNKIDLFKLLRHKEYDKVINYLNANKDLELNVQDKYNNYFIEVVLDLENIELLKAVFKHNISLDIIDNNGSTLLFNIIKFNKIEILNLIIDFNKSSNIIGIDILDKQDIMGKTPLHYAIYFDNEEIFDILIENNVDVFIQTTKNINSFFYCLKYERTDLLIKLLDKYTNYNDILYDDENLLMTAISYENYEIINYLLNTDIDINYQVKENGFCALHQIVSINNTSYFNKILEKDPEINLYTFNGYSLFHLAIINRNIDILDKLLEINKTSKNPINFNINNDDGNTALHLILFNYNDFSNNIIEVFIKNTNLNIQNNDGDTCLYYIVKNNLLVKYKDILKEKELNIFVKNNIDKLIYDLIEDDKIFDIVASSYYNTLKNKKKKLIKQWEINCAEHKNKTECMEKIKSKIINKKRSIPAYSKVNIDIDTGLSLSNNCFFTSELIDTVFCILWLYNKFKDHDRININILLSDSILENYNYQEYYKKLGTNLKNNIDFYNCCIFWSYQNLFVPNYYDNLINKLTQNIDKEKKNYIVIPINIENGEKGHANILLWNLNENIIIRFEPNGSREPNTMYYNSGLLDIKLKTYFEKINPKITYIKPNKYLPIIGFQVIENISNKNCRNIGDPNGFCLVWCIWFIHHFIINQHISLNKISCYLINNLKLNNINFKDMIRNYSKNISKLRDEYLEKVDLDINKYINNKYSIKKILSLEKKILNNIYYNDE